LTYLSSIISKDDGSSEDIQNRIAKAQGVFFAVGSSEDIQNRIAKAQGVFFAVEKVWKNQFT
jgi:cyanophycinase-like exopeptidase